MSLQLHLFGQPELSSSGDKQALRLNHPVLLLFYLAVKADWVSRSELAFLFRPDDDEVSALTHIRLLLHRAKQYDWAKSLEVDKRRARFLIKTDIAMFRQAFYEQNWPLAAKLYAAPFLGDYSSADLATYSAWIDIERSDLETTYQDTLRKYANDLEAQGQFQGASHVLKDLLKLDALDEAVLKVYLKNLYLAGQKDRALKAYESFSSLLKTEYKAEPLEDTRELMAHILKDEHEAIDILTDKQNIVAKSKKISSNLPSQSTRFIGRKQELQELTEQLKDESCRLLTLVGLGGTGKTRLALELARLEQGRFKDGVCFVALAPLKSATSLAMTLAQTLGLTLAPRQDPKEQVIRFLTDKELLLILDNFEDLLEAAPLLGDLLERTEGLKVVVSSRECLKLVGEWLFDLEGLAYPKRLGTSRFENSSMDLGKKELESFDAVTLFINSAKRVVPRLELSDEDFPIIAEICQQVEGLPLALELAASWVRLMPVTHIARDLKKGYGLLETAQADVAHRHRNLKTILETTWQGLSEKKRETLAKLAVFQGGCTLEAAEEITSTHFTLLLSLVNQSLLKRIPPNRFDLHSVVKHFAATKLAELGETQVLREQHFSFYKRETQQSDADFQQGKRHGFWADWFQLEQENLRSAISFGLDHQLSELAELLHSVQTIWTASSGSYPELIAFTNQALENNKRIETGPPISDSLSARLIILKGKCLLKTSQFKQAEAALSQGIDLAKRLEMFVDANIALASLAALSSDQGNHLKAIDLAEEALIIAKNINHKRQINLMLGYLGVFALRQKDYQKARAVLEETIALARQQNAKRILAGSLINLANLYRRIGLLQKAESAYQESLELSKEMKDSNAKAVAQVNLGHLYLLQKDAAKAYTLQRQGIQTLFEIDDKFWFINALPLLAHSYLALCKASESAILLGAIESLSKGFGIPINASQHQEYYQVITETQKKLDKTNLDSCISQGRDMTKLTDAWSFIESVKV